MTPSREIDRLIEIMAALRAPNTGCPWDLAQNFATIAPYTLEEAYEVADAIERDHLADLKEELGNLLLQVVFHARMAEEQDAFAFGDVVEAITQKLRFHKQNHARCPRWSKTGTALHWHAKALTVLDHSTGRVFLFSSALHFTIYPSKIQRRPYTQQSLLGLLAPLEDLKGRRSLSPIRHLQSLPR